MTLASLFIVCAHGRRSAHGKPEDEPYRDGEWCQGGRPATLEDLGGLGLFIPKENGEWPPAALDALWRAGSRQWTADDTPETRMRFMLDFLVEELSLSLPDSESVGVE